MNLDLINSEGEYEPRTKYHVIALHKNPPSTYFSN